MKSNGTLDGWGNNCWDELNLAGGNLWIAVAGGYIHSVALRITGSIWAHGGTGYYGQSDPPGGVVSSPIVERYSYDVFGKPTIKAPDGSTRTTSNFGNRFMFTGRECDNETGNYYYRARYYNPVVGRFLQTDPIGYKGGMNLYTYCGNNPLNYIDPWGLAHIRSRQLAIRILRPLANWAYGRGDERGEHWQIFYDDGTNSGYFGDKNDRIIFEQDEGGIGTYPYVRSGHLDDNLMRMAEREVQERWRREYAEGGRRYRHPYNDCHTYVTDVLYTYNRLLREQHERERQLEEDYQRALRDMAEIARLQEELKQSEKQCPP